ncbi:hypothetical protein PoB_005997900 [Plakobranchus ocellatus]|uniref:Uncharacterized protein n=1 Tax=Plakobranchus ocellatus TaxID=259542 RepID=A0AAV4CNN4_9GAST|nr:hypothetical protein PoB_005997900 [Plakobranchus ocellatus]
MQVAVGWARISDSHNNYDPSISVIRLSPPSPIYTLALLARSYHETPRECAICQTRHIPSIPGNAKGSGRPGRRSLTHASSSASRNKNRFWHRGLSARSRGVLTI